VGTEEKVAAAAAVGAQQQASKPAAPAKPAAPHVAKPMGPNVKMETLSSMAELPAKFKRKPFSAEEMAAINVSAHNCWNAPGWPNHLDANVFEQLAIFSCLRMCGHVHVCARVFA
jgi:hypothetical protein